MSEDSKGLDTLAEQSQLGPDYFGYYNREVAELFLRNEDFLPFSFQTYDLAGRTHGVIRERDITKENCEGKECNSFIGSGSLFYDAVGAGLSDFRKERLKALLRQSVVALTREVDEMLDPVIAMCRLQSYLRSKQSLSSCLGVTYKGDAGQHPQKKLKLSSSSSSISIPLHASPVNCSISGEGSGDEHIDVAVQGKGMSNGVQRKCTNCGETRTPQWRSGPSGHKSLCNACGMKFRKGKEYLSIEDQKRESYLGSNIGPEKENGEVNDDLQFLVENDGSMVKETMKKYSDELSKTLEYMEQKVEELLNTVMSNCRSMTRAEKQQLQKLIRKLPPRNLDRVVEIIRHRKPSEKYSRDEIHVDLEEEDNVTLWRLYYYVETVENARKLSV